mmetsp:Transcript_105292/g.128536  ORF Transcript_105292/g.128536 Transcript_105292/m.128536 type:complete len:108 (+) Transcript_105292:21-344(+)
MSLNLVKQHFELQHNKRFKKEIKEDKQKSNFKDTVISQQNVLKRKKIIARKIRTKLDIKKSEIKNYRYNLTENVKNNIIALRRLYVKNNDTQWKSEIDIIRNIAKKI